MQKITPKYFLVQATIYKLGNPNQKQKMNDIVKPNRGTVNESRLIEDTKNAYAQHYSTDFADILLDDFSASDKRFT